MALPPLSATAANLERVGQAGAALVGWLNTDPRVQLVYCNWCIRRLPWARIDSEALDAIRRHKTTDLLMLDRFVRDDLGLPYAWLAPLLLFNFGTLFFGGVYPIQLLTATAEDLPAGRRAKWHGEYIVRDVGWFYRHEVKKPAETAYALAKEYAEQERTAGVWHSTVETGIARAKRLLAALDTDSAI